MSHRNYKKRQQVRKENATYQQASHLFPTQPTYTEMVPMRDGIKLYTEVFLPPKKDSYHQSASEPKSDSFPVILVRSPYPYGLPSYNDKRPISRYWTAGYAFVFQNTRGQGRSEGVFRMFKDDENDGYDCIEWIARQVWCDGSVGMEGSSYLGNTQLLAARAKPAALKCIIPAAFVGNCIRSFPFSCGVPNKGPYMQWHRVVDLERLTDLDFTYGDMAIINHPEWGPAMRKRPLIDAANTVLEGDKLESWRETISNPIDNEYWKSVHFDDDELAELDLPIFFIDGWYDMTIGPIDYFIRMEKACAKKKDRYLLVGPWDHYQTFSNSIISENNGDRTLPDGGHFNHIEQRIKFFDRYLRGDKNTKVQKNRVSVYITGVPESNANVWMDFSTLPAPNTENIKIYLHSQGNAHLNLDDGLLNFDRPIENPMHTSKRKAFDRYIYNPENPTHSIVESSMDRRDIESRADVLTYTSAPLVKPLTILGNITLMLYAASSAIDTDWFAVVTEVFPDGKSVSFHYSPPAFRARYREGFDREVFLTRNKAELFCIPMGPAGHHIIDGNRLRLSIFSSAFPEYDPNSNTGSPAATDTATKIATQTIYHNSAYPSHLVIPTIKIS